MRASIGRSPENFGDSGDALFIEGGVGVPLPYDFELGASLGPTLRIQAEEMRRKRFQAAEKKAMQAPVLMLFPLVAFIFPLVFILTFAPLAIRFMKEDPLSAF